MDNGCIYQNDYDIYLQFDQNWQQERGMGAEDTSFIGFNNSKLVQKSSYC